MLSSELEVQKGGGSETCLKVMAGLVQQEGSCNFASLILIEVAP